MPTRPETTGAALLIDRRNGRVLVHKPFRWCRRGRAQYDFQAGIRKDVHGAIQPLEPELVASRFQFRPGKFSDPDVGDPNVSHAARVFWPPGFWPVFGVVTDAKH